MAEVGVVLDTLQFVSNNLFSFDFDAVVILLNLLFHAVYAVLVYKVGDNGNFAIRLCLGGYPFVINHDLTVKNRLLNALVEVVCYRSHEHTLRKIGDFGWRYQAIHLGRDRGRFIIVVNGHALAFLH